MHTDTFLRRLWRVLVILGAAAAAGCGSGRNSAPVSGIVTLNGEPQEGIYVYFQPTAPPGSDPMDVGTSSYARTDAEGRFTLSFMDIDKDRPGALIGTHTVKLDDERTFGGGPPDERGGGRVPRSRVPRGWKSTFEVTKDGATDANFNLGKK